MPKNNRTAIRNTLLYSYVTILVTFHVKLMLKCVTLTHIHCFYVDI